MKKKEKQKSRSIKSSAWMIAAGVAFTLAVNALLLIIISNSEKLGYMFPVLVILLFALLLGATAFIIWKREMKWLKAVLGEDLFYEKFPREKAKEERRKKRQTEKEKRNKPQ